MRAIALVTLLAAAAASGCGGASGYGSGGSATQAPGPGAAGVVALSISSGSFKGPSSVKGGLLTLQLTNTGSAPHSAQLIRLEGGHTIAQAVAALSAQTTATPDWLRAEGGVGLVRPSARASATMLLAPGAYAVLDLTGAQEHQIGSPVVMPLTVTAGAAASLPGAATTITAVAPGPARYRWQISGPLKVGANAVRFVSEGASAVHELTAVRLPGSRYAGQFVKALEGTGPPPSFVDRTTTQQTAVLDGGKSLLTTLTFTRPGTYVFFCHLSDRSGGRPHFAEGLLSTVVVR